LGHQNPNEFLKLFLLEVSAETSGNFQLHKLWLCRIVSPLKERKISCTDPSCYKLDISDTSLSVQYSDNINTKMADSQSTLSKARMHASISAQHTNKNVPEASELLNVFILLYMTLLVSNSFAQTEQDSNVCQK